MDIIAVPKYRTAIPTLIAVQCKYHRLSKKTPSSVVRDLQGVLSRGIFDVGMLFTNTSFTADAKWVAAQRPQLVRLRDFSDLKRLIAGQISDEDWRETPQEVELANGVRIRIPTTDELATATASQRHLAM